MKPKVFIGSSSEGLTIAYALQSNLEQDAQVTVWTQDVFKPSEFILESLLEQLNTADIGIFVPPPDDTVVIRGVGQAAVRDNVIFEVALYVGRLGQDRCFIVFPRGSNPRLPSDLLGVNLLNYDGARADGRWEAATGPASSKIRLALAALAPTLHPGPVELGVSIMERVAMLSARQAALLQGIGARAPVTKSTLDAHFPDMAGSELRYRLEQLRLLQFLTVLEAGGSDAAQWALHPAYDYARQGKRSLGTT